MNRADWRHRANGIAPRVVESIATPDDRRNAMMVNKAAVLAGKDVLLADCAKRVRVFFAGQCVADSKRVRLMHERDHLPVYYFPLADIRDELLIPSDRTSHCPRKGEARYWTVRVGDRLAEDALWSYPEPLEGCPDISGLAAFYWNRMDAWFEEDEQVFVHARDPYSRIDVLESSRRVEVKLGDVTVAESHRPVLLVETGLPVRYYLPKLDVRMELLRPTDTVTACPYKGET
ncbi:MAG: DUF427 domain-containing protein, partial [Nitrococcus sp.]|nr:DUF427 domain-containing protein [Nitrococcus sp.]